MKSIKRECLALCLSGSLLFVSCVNEKERFIRDNIQLAENQTILMLKTVGEPNGENYPRTTDDAGNPVVTDRYDWTPGFFPGSLWYLYELTGDTLWQRHAEKWTNSLEKLKTFTGHHDLGFMMYCSYGNAERLVPQPGYKEILIQSAYSLASRFDKRTGAIKSWNYHKGWDGVSEWFYPVIIDNLMNLEMLFYGAKASGDKNLYNIAVTHANTTLKNHFRDDYSSYHVVNYDTLTGDVKHKATCQGFSDNSTWARGQAWAMYGYTMIYRETNDSTYLNAAIRIADYYLKHLPEDLIPFWDFNVGQEGYTPGIASYASQYPKKLKDVSAAAVVCSALFELDKFAANKDYTGKAVKMLKTLSSDEYLARSGENAGFILKHGVGSIPHKTEIDKPLVYADYYYLEALIRYKKLNSK